MSVDRGDFLTLARPQNYQCFWCDQVLTREKANRDHLIAAYHGGSWVRENIVITCLDCNNKRSRITQAYQFAIREPDRCRWTEARVRRLVPLLNRFARLIVAKIPGWRGRILLEEIDAVRARIEEWEMTRQSA